MFYHCEPIACPSHTTGSTMQRGTADGKQNDDTGRNRAFSLEDFLVRPLTGRDEARGTKDAPKQTFRLAYSS